MNFYYTDACNATAIGRSFFIFQTMFQWILFDSTNQINPCKSRMGAGEGGGEAGESKTVIAESASVERWHLPMSTVPTRLLDFDWSNAIQLIKPSRNPNLIKNFEKWW